MQWKFQRQELSMQAVYDRDADRLHFNLQGWHMEAHLCGAIWEA